MANNRIVIDTGSIEIPIKRDGTDRGTFTMNVKDVSFLKRVYELLKKGDVLFNNYRLKNEVLKKNKAVDKWGFPMNLDEVIKLNETTIDELKELADKTFGEGVSDMVFGDCRNVEVFVSFFHQIKSIVDEQRSKVVGKYIDDIDESKIDVDELADELV